MARSRRPAPAGALTEVPLNTIDDILGRLGLERALLADGDLEVRTPVTGEPLARTHRTNAAGTDAAIGRAVEAFEVWRDVPAPRRGELVRLLGEELRAREGRARRARHARDRQDRAGRPRRGAGDDRHLRLRRRALATALRPDDRLGAARPPDARDMASAGPGRRHHGLQLPGCGVELERRARARLRRSGRLEAVASRRR